MGEITAEYWKRRGFILAAIGSATGLGNIWVHLFICLYMSGHRFILLETHPLAWFHPSLGRCPVTLGTGLERGVL